MPRKTEVPAAAEDVTEVQSEVIEAPVEATPDPVEAPVEALATVGFPASIVGLSSGRFVRSEPWGVFHVSPDEAAELVDRGGELI